jgi:hypothetical protein
MSRSEITLAVVGVVALLALLYAFIRFGWLLWKGDELVRTGSDSDLFRRRGTRPDEPAD